MEVTSTRRWLALGALVLAMLTFGLDTTVLTVALPTLAVDLHAGTGALQWFNTAYTLALAAVMVPAGVLGDRFGRKKFLLGAMMLFGAASLACAFADSSGQLIAMRAVLGVGAAAMVPLSMAVLPVLFQDPAQRRRALTIWITSTAIGLPLGPILGGWLLQNYWWGSVFLINLPLIAIGAVAVAVLVPESRSEIRYRIDLLGVVLSGGGMVALTYGCIRAGGQGWGDGLALTAIAVGLAALAAFVGWQRSIEHPLIDLGLFASAGFSWGTAYLILVNFALFGMFFTVPQYFQAVLGADALGSGLRLLPMIGGLLVGTRLVDRLLAKTGTKTALIIGFALLAVGLGAGALTTVDSGYGYTAVWISLLGVGMGFVMPAAMGLAMGALTEERSGSGSALLQALRQAGGAIGIAVLGTVLATQYRGQLGPLNHAPISDGVNAGAAVAAEVGDMAMLAHVQTAFVSGMSVMLWVCAAICALAIGLVAFRTPRPAAATANGPAAATANRAAASDTAESVHVG